jgi:hypothetical protein
MSTEDVRRSLADGDGPDYYGATLAVYQETAQIRVLIEAIEELKAERVKLIELDALDNVDAADLVARAGGEASDPAPTRWCFGACRAREGSDDDGTVSP